MSGNINDTDIFEVKKQVTDLIIDIQSIQNKNENLDEWESHLQNKYKKLFKTSKTLFNYILKNYGTEKFDSVFFNNTINMMLSKISSIQLNKISQENASAVIGTHLAEAYIPQLKKK